MITTRLAHLRCPLCRAPIVDRDDHNQPSPERLVPAVMYVCANGHRIVEPDRMPQEPDR